MALGFDKRQAQCERMRRTEATLACYPDPNHKRHLETNMTDTPIRAESARCNSNIIDFAQAQRERAASTWAQRPDFVLALALTRQTKAEYEFLAASNHVEHLMHGTPLENGYPEIHHIWGVYRSQIAALAEIPAHNARELRMKKSAIGDIWLKTEGVWYDNLRAAVARDESRLGSKKPRCKKVKRGS